MATDLSPLARAYAGRVLKQAGFGGKTTFVPADVDAMLKAVPANATGARIAVADATEVYLTQTAALLALASGLRDAAAPARLAVLSRDSLFARGLGTDPAAQIEVKHEQ